MLDYEVQISIEWYDRFDALVNYQSFETFNLK